MLTKDAIKDRLSELSYNRAPDSPKYADEYDLGPCVFYIRTIKREYDFAVIDRPTRDFLATAKLPGIILGVQREKTSFRRFKEKNAAGSNIGFLINFETLSVFNSFITAVAGREEDTLSSDLEAIVNSSSLTNTQKQTLVNARVGQGAFRKSLISAWDAKCAVTGVWVPDLLRASHVKPWATSTDEERLDCNNGLLLIANLDAAFDKHLLSFTDEGEILLSNALGPDGYAVLGISKNACLRKPLTAKQKAYLSEHRRRLR